MIGQWIYTNSTGATRWSTWLLLAGRRVSGATALVQQRVLGRTGEKVSCIGMGGFHLGGAGVSRQDAIRLVRQGLDNGINFLDNSWDYNEGESEIRMGMALRDGYRQKAFLMTTFDGRTKESAARQIDESLKRVNTDHVDLLQFHEVIRFDVTVGLSMYDGLTMEAWFDTPSAFFAKNLAARLQKSPREAPLLSAK